MTDQRTCPARRQDGEVCGRPARLWKYDDGTEEVACICHSKEPTKDKVEFQKALDELFADESSDCYDLSWFVFPDGNWVFPQKITKDIYFLHAVFEGEISFAPKNGPRRTFQGLADFSHSVFNSDASFTNCDFQGEARFSYGTKFLAQITFTGSHFAQYANFKGCVFHVPPESGMQDADFRLCTFERNSSFRDAKFYRASCFSNTTFHGDANFSMARFFHHADFHSPIISDRTGYRPTLFNGMARFAGTQFMDAKFTRCEFRNGADFREAKFTASIDFRYCRFSAPGKVLFEKNDLSKAFWAGSDISRVIFRNVSWHWEPRKFLHSRRNIIAEELSLKDRAKKRARISLDEYELAAQTYRQLQQNYGESYRYPEAGDFYVGEQEMELSIRKENSKILAVASWLYKVTSNYGEDVLSPVILLAVVIFASVCCLLLSGFCPHADRFDTLENVYVNYDLSVSLDGISSFGRGDFWLDLVDAFNVNLDILLLRSDAADKHLSTSCQKLVMRVELLLVVVFLTFFILALRRKFKRKSF